MTTNYMAKPLMGDKILKHRNKIMNYQHKYKLNSSSVWALHDKRNYERIYFEERYIRDVQYDKMSHLHIKRIQQKRIEFLFTYNFY